MPIAFPEFLQVSAQLALIPVPVLNLFGDGLKMEWSIERTRSSTPDWGTVTIYNLSVAARKLIHETWKQLAPTLGYIMEFSIGWGGLVERIFVGDAWKIVPEMRMGEDILTIFELGDGGKQTRDSVATLGSGMAETTFIALILILVEFPATGLGVPMDPASKAKIIERAGQLSVKKFNNYAGGGNTTDALDDLMAMLGLEWKIYQGSFIVMERGVAATASPTATLLSAQTGLLSWSMEDDGGISVSALANPNVKPGSQIMVVDSFGKPVGAPAHRVEQLSFTGATDGESTMQIMARKSVLL